MRTEPIKAPHIDFKYGYRFTNAIISTQMGIPLTKVRRYAKDFLGADEEATRQSGKTRLLSATEALIIYLGGYLITELRFTTEECKAIINDIRPWLRTNRLMPGMKPEPDEYMEFDNIDADRNLVSVTAPMYYHTVIYIMRANTDSGFYYKTHKELAKTSRIKNGKRVVKEDYEEGVIVPEPKGKFLLDDRTMYLLPINTLKSDLEAKLFSLPNEVIF